jgi:hypothetical protein
MKTNYYIKAVCLLTITFLWAACEKEDSMTGITVDKESLSLLLGSNAQITVNPIPAGIDVDTRTYEWSSDNEAIATVTPFGVVHSVEEGACNITVRHGSFSQTVPVTITDPIVVPSKKAHWKFDDAANLTAATIGNALEYAKGTGAGFECPTADITGFTAIAGPKSDNKAVRINMRYSFRARHGIPAPTDGASIITEYTLMFDFQLPVIGVYYTFFQTDPGNAGDGDCFVRPAGTIGVGSTGYTENPVVTTANVWHRLVVSVKLGAPSYNYYLDGEPIRKVSTPLDPTRFGLDLTYLLFFADDSDEDNDIDISEIAIWNEALDDDQIKKLERTESKLR